MTRRRPTLLTAVLGDTRDCISGTKQAGGVKLVRIIVPETRNEPPKRHGKELVRGEPSLTMHRRQMQLLGPATRTIGRCVGTGGLWRLEECCAVTTDRIDADGREGGSRRLCTLSHCGGEGVIREFCWREFSRGC